MNCSNEAEIALARLNKRIVSCKRCPRLIEHCRAIAVKKRRAYMDWTYWGKPVPSFGDPNARLLIMGLAPGAHGSNRTGRMFSGDKSGEYLYRSLYRAGFASQPTSVRADDGLELRDAWITAAAHCAPPDNMPDSVELTNCSSWLHKELSLLERVSVVVTLGSVAHQRYLEARGLRPGAYKFAHNVLFELDPPVLSSYHPSQQNTSTGRLTQDMLDEVFLRAAELIRSSAVPSASLP